MDHTQKYANAIIMPLSFFNIFIAIFNKMPCCFVQYQTVLLLLFADASCLIQWRSRNIVIGRDHWTWGDGPESDTSYRIPIRLGACGSVAKSPSRVCGKWFFGRFYAVLCDVYAWCSTFWKLATSIYIAALRDRSHIKAATTVTTG